MANTQTTAGGRCLRSQTHHGRTIGGGPMTPDRDCVSTTTTQTARSVRQRWDQIYRHNFLFCMELTNIDKNSGFAAQAGKQRKGDIQVSQTFLSVCLAWESKPVPTQTSPKTSIFASIQQTRHFNPPAFSAIKAHLISQPCCLMTVSVFRVFGPQLRIRPEDCPETLLMNS